MQKKILDPGQRGRRFSLAALAATWMVTLAGCSAFAMSEEDAGKHYMGIVCPSNATVDGYNAALETGDLGQIQTAAKTMAEAYRESAKALSSTDTHWPDSVATADLQTLADSYLTDLAVINTITSATTVDEARVIWPNDPAVGEASQRVRLALDLPSDTSLGCD